MKNWSVYKKFKVQFEVEGSTLADGAELSIENIEELLYNVFDRRGDSSARNELDCALLDATNIEEVKQ